MRLWIGAVLAVVVIGGLACDGSRINECEKVTDRLLAAACAYDEDYCHEPERLTSLRAERVWKCVAGAGG